MKIETIANSSNHDALQAAISSDKIISESC